MNQLRFILVLLLFNHFLNAAAVGTEIKGIVFSDTNKNGILDRGEPGIGGVCVSNGMDVVLSGVDGKWKLRLNGNNPVFVIKPAGYSIPVGKNNIPRHYVLQQDVLNDQEIHFPIIPAKEDTSFSTLFFGDTQARGLREVNFILHDVVEECIGTDAAFGVTLGDIVADDPNLFKEVSEGIGQIGIPWYNIFGNHDHDRNERNNEDKDKTFRNFFGPSTYAFEYGQVVFVGLNNIFFNSEGKYKSSLTESQLLFVENYLRQVPDEKLIVLIMHAPLVRTEGRERLYEILHEREHTFSISGHVHEQINLFIDEKDGWRNKKPHHHLVNATVCGSWWCGLHDETGIPHATMNDGAPNGYSIISFEGNQYRVRFKAARKPDSYQMNIYLPDEIDTADLDTTSVLVNVFAGSERSTVEMRIGNNSNWIPLEQVDTIDPEVLRMHQLSPYLDMKAEDKSLEYIFGYKMDYPSISTHMWKANLPARIKEGTHTITVRTTDMFNQTWTGHRIFRIVSQKSTL